MDRANLRLEMMTAAKFGAVGCVGFLTDITLFHLGVRLGLSPLTARLISLACAMQATFLINGLAVFRCLRAARFLRQWASYMATNGLGNACNWLIFAGLVVSRLPVVSRHGPALVLGSMTAYGINYVAVRLLVFGRPQGAGHDVCHVLGAKDTPA